jgi:hypothetical protein
MALIQQNFENAAVGEYARLAYTRDGVFIELIGMGGNFKVVEAVGAPLTWGRRHLSCDNQNALSDRRPYIKVNLYKEYDRLNDDDIGVHQISFQLTTCPGTPEILPWVEVYGGAGYDLEWELKMKDRFTTFPHNRSFSWGVGYSPIGGAPDIGVITSADFYDCDLDMLAFVR